jgi:hypothetical protein
MHFLFLFFENYVGMQSMSRTSKRNGPAHLSFASGGASVGRCSERCRGAPLRPPSPLVRSLQSLPPLSSRRMCRCIRCGMARAGDAAAPLRRRGGSVGGAAGLAFSWSRAERNGRRTRDHHVSAAKESVTIVDCWRYPCLSIVGSVEFSGTARPFSPDALDCWWMIFFQPGYPFPLIS